MAETQQGLMLMPWNRLSGLAGASETVTQIGSAWEKHTPAPPGCFRRIRLSVASIRVLLHSAPFRKLGQFSPWGAGPVAEFALQQTGLLVHSQPGATCSRGGGLQSALQWGGVDGAQVHH